MKIMKYFSGTLLSLVMALGLMIGMSLTAKAGGTSYGVSVGGTPVTSEITTGPGWSYDDSSKTLTLNNYSYSGEGYNNEADVFAAIYAAHELKIVLNGNSNVRVAHSNGISYGVYIEGDLTVEGNGSLNASTNLGMGIYSDQRVKINSGTLTATGYGDGRCGIFCELDVTINGGTITATANGGEDDAPCIGIMSFKGDVNISGGTVTATASDEFFRGIEALSEDVIISGGTVIAAGSYGGIRGKVTNSIAGTGWRNKEGTGEGTAIQVSESGQDLLNYNRVEFISPLAVVTKKPTAKTLTYTGSEQELVTAGTATVTANSRTYDGTEKPLVSVTGEATGGEMQYSIGTDATTAPTSGFSTSIPAATDAGTYYVWYKVAGDKNHNDTEPACVTVTISPKEAESESESESETESEKQSEKQDTTPSDGGGGSIPQTTTESEPAPTPTPSETVQQPATTEPSITQDAFTGIYEVIEPSTNGTVSVNSVAGNSGKTLRITGTVNQNGTTYPVSSFATKSFSNVSVNNIIIDLKTSGNTQTVTFQPRTFKGSEAKKLTLRLSSSGQVKFSKGTFSGSKVKNVVVSGLKKKEFKRVEKKLKKAGYKGTIVKK